MICVAQAFSNCTSLAKVTIGKKVKKIGRSAFACCEKLTSVTIPSSVKYIGPSAFENCMQLKTLVIGKGVKKIGENAFYNCKNLESITIKSTKLVASNVGEGAFTVEDMEKENITITINVPKSNKKAYKKILYKRGIDKDLSVITTI